MAYLEYDTEEYDGLPNIVSCFAADGTHLCEIAWRPWNPALRPTFLFICG